MSKVTSISPDEDDPEYYWAMMELSDRCLAILDEFGEPRYMGMFRLLVDELITQINGHASPASYSPSHPDLPYERVRIDPDTCLGRHLQNSPFTDAIHAQLYKVLQNFLSPSMQKREREYNGGNTPGMKLNILFDFLSNVGDDRGGPEIFKTTSTVEALVTGVFSAKIRTNCARELRAFEKTIADRCRELNIGDSSLRFVAEYFTTLRPFPNQSRVHSLKVFDSSATRSRKNFTLVLATGGMESRDLLTGDLTVFHREEWPSKRSIFFTIRRLNGPRLFPVSILVSSSCSETLEVTFHGERKEPIEHLSARRSIYNPACGMMQLNSSFRVIRAGSTEKPITERLFESVSFTSECLPHQWRLHVSPLKKGETEKEKNDSLQGGKKHGSEAAGKVVSLLKDNGTKVEKCVDSLVADRMYVSLLERLNCLFEALKTRNWPLAREIINRGMGMSHYLANGETPLHRALLVKAPSSILNALVTDPKVCDLDAPLIHDGYIFDPLTLAVYTSADTKTVTELLKRCKWNARVKSRLMFRAMGAFAPCDLVECLIREGQVDVNTWDMDHTYAFYAVRNRVSLDVIELLVRYGADIFTRCYLNCDLLSAAVAWRPAEPEITRFLLKKGADPNQPLGSVYGPSNRRYRSLIQKERNLTVLIYACSFPVKQPEIDARVDPMQASVPQYLAKPSDMLEIVKILLEFGADPLVKDDYGINAFDAALLFDNSACVRLLREHLMRQNVISGGEPWFRFDLQCCSSCGSKPGNKPLMRCSGCGVARYCGGLHQKEDWSARHQQECLAFRQKKPMSRIFPHQGCGEPSGLLPASNKFEPELFASKFLRRPTILDVQAIISHGERRSVADMEITLDDEPLHTQKVPLMSELPPEERFGNGNVFSAEKYIVGQRQGERIDDYL